MRLFNRKNFIILIHNLEQININRLLSLIKILIFSFIYLIIVIWLINIWDTRQNRENGIDITKNYFDIQKLPLKEKLIHIHFTRYTFDAQISNLILKYSKLYDLDFYLVFTLIKEESNFDKFKITRKDNTTHLGLLQLSKERYPGLSTIELFTPENNLKTGLESLIRALDKSEDNLIKALAMYKRGTSAIKKKQLGKDTLDFIQSILNGRKEIKKETMEFIQQNYDLF